MSTSDEIDDPGRDPAGLNPTRDILDAVSGVDPEKGGSFNPPGGSLDPLVASDDEETSADES
jgi:hypothetical protein